MIGERWVVLEEGWALWDRKTRTIVVNMVARMKDRFDAENLLLASQVAADEALWLAHHCQEGVKVNQICYCWDLATWEDFASAT